MDPSFHSGINNTLRDKLFLNPNPLSNIKEEFFILHDRIFPDKELFIRFLNTSEEQQKKEIAKEILLRLCYESNFAPIYELILNVLNMEERLSSDNYSSHVGRDHFIHLVNLYLLGTYTFFYNLEFNKKLYTCFRLNRYSNINESLKLNAVKDFISSWKYFVLYHDLAYPFEFFGSDGNDSLSKLNSEVLNEIKKDVFSFFNKDYFKENFIFELGIKSVSKLLMVNRELKYLSREFNILFNHLKYKLDNKLLFSKYDNRFEIVDNSTFSDIFQTSKISNVYKLQNIHTGESLKYILSVFRKSDLMYVLSNTITGHIVAIVLPNQEKEHIVLFTEQYKENIKFTNLLSENPKMFFNDESFYKNIFVDYYIIDPYVKFDSFLNNIATFEGVRQRGITRENLDLVLDNITGSINEPTIISDVDFLNYSFNFYKNVRETLIGSKKTYSYSFYNTQNEVYKRFNPIINESITKACTRLIKNTLEKNVDLDKLFEKECTESNVQQLILEWTEKALSSIVNIPWKEQADSEKEDSIVSGLINEYTSSFQARLILNKIKDCVVEKIRNTFKSIDADFYVESINEKDINMNDEIISNFESAIIQEINGKISRAFGIPDLEINELISHYKISYTKHDHGICGFKIYLQHLKFYRHYFRSCINNSNLINEGGLLPWHEGNNTNVIRIKYLDNYDNLIPEIGFSLLMHNIYPVKFDELKLRKYKTSLNNDPFAYYTILCDSLQHWNRPHIMNPALRKVNKSILSNFFNIEIQEKEIKIYIVCCNNSESIEYINNLSLALEEYLSEAKSKVRILISG